jgi:hypothetical protein
MKDVYKSIAKENILTYKKTDNRMEKTTRFINVLVCFSMNIIRIINHMGWDGHNMQHAYTK